MPPARSASPLYRWVRRLTADNEQRDAERLRRASARSGCVPAEEACRGHYVVLTGRLRTVVYTPRTNLPALEAELFDGSAAVTLVWLGRRKIAGIEPGRVLTVRGRLAMRDGGKVIFNPYYELATGSDEG